MIFVPVWSVSLGLVFLEPKLMEKFVMEFLEHLRGGWGEQQVPEIKGIYSNTMDDHILQALAAYALMASW